MYDQVAGEFLNKYLIFEEFDTNFKRRKIQVDGVTMTVEDFAKKINNHISDTTKKKEHNSVELRSYWRRGRDSNPRVLLAQTDFE